MGRPSFVCGETRGNLGVPLDFPLGRSVHVHDAGMGPAGREARMSERERYLLELADEFGIPIEAVEALADVLGDTELYDGLVTELEDAAMEGWF